MKKLIQYMDKKLLLFTLIFLVACLVLLGSASSLRSYMEYGNSFHYFSRQIIFAIAGLIAMFFICIIPTNKYKSLSWLGIISIIGLLFYVLINGDYNNGIRGWLNIGSFGVQPSEFAKIILIVFLATMFESLIKIKEIKNKVIYYLPFLASVILVALVFAQPDAGTAIIITGITAVIYLVLPIEFKEKLLIGSSVLILGVLSIIVAFQTDFISDMQKSRLTNFKDPCSRYREDSGYQVCNGYIALNQGGLKGSGVGNSKQKYLYLPEAHTDFIFAVIIEEIGFIGGIIIFLFYFLLIRKIVSIGSKSHNLRGCIICYGVAAYIVFHIMVNLSGLMGVFPLTGVPLPFFSSGGSFLITLLASLGFVQRVAIENKVFYQKHLVR